MCVNVHRIATSLAALVEIATSTARAGLVVFARSVSALAEVVPVGQAELRPIYPRALQ